MWEHDPSDWDLYLNVSGTEYINAENEEYQQIELLGKSALFTNGRLTDADIPQGGCIAIICATAMTAVASVLSNQRSALIAAAALS